MVGAISTNFYRTVKEMTKDMFYSHVCGVIRATEYRDLVKALTYRYIADRSMESIKQSLFVTEDTLFKAHSLITKFMTIPKDVIPSKFTYEDIYHGYALEIEEMRQILMDKSFTYVPLDARVYEAIQIDDFSWEDAHQTFNMPVPRLKRIFSNAAYTYFESFHIPQPMFRSNPMKKVIHTDELLSLTKLSGRNAVIMTEFVKKGHDIDDIASKVGCSSTTVEKTVDRLCQTITNVMRKKGMRLTTNLRNSNIRGGDQTTPFFYKTSSGMVHA